jgi:hypothetical protein
LKDIDNKLDVEAGKLAFLLFASVFSFIGSLFGPYEVYSNELTKKNTVFQGFKINSGKTNKNIQIFCQKKNITDFSYKINRFEKDNTNLKILKSINYGDTITAFFEDEDLYQLVYKNRKLINLKKANTQRAACRHFFRYMPIVWLFFMYLPLKNLSKDEEIELREITLFGYKYTMKLDIYYGLVILLTTILISYLMGWKP